MSVGMSILYRVHSISYHIPPSEYRILHTTLQIYCTFIPGGDSDAASCLGNTILRVSPWVKPSFLEGSSDPFPFGDSGEPQTELQP
ncbi:hypothetical protein VN97_g12324 [Penicillium thymicola]|uniref:Uncharacterized protein n=1 Tax=Penicillium thymicola TaxID=293382 RepID=A0AAI9T769_PENTH|nr:hypothetical protein VN97_g12324 [Penicillium thymicola]